MLLLFFVIVITIAFRQAGVSMFKVRVAVGVLVIAMYEPVLIAVGCTLGQWLTGIRVRAHRDHTQRILVWRALYRLILKLALGWVSFFTMGFNKERRAIHDLAAGTVVLDRRQLGTAA